MLFEIGKQIRRAKKNRHITQAELAIALGMSRTTIGQIEMVLFRRSGCVN